MISLHLSRKDKWLGGLFGGIGEYTKVNANFLRLIFFVLFFFTNLSWVLFFAYIAAVIIVPEEEKN